MPSAQYHWPEALLTPEACVSLFVKRRRAGPSPRRTCVPTPPTFMRPWNVICCWLLNHPTCKWNSLKGAIADLLLWNNKTRRWAKRWGLFLHIYLWLLDTFRGNICLSTLAPILLQAPLRSSLVPSLTEWGLSHKLEPQEGPGIWSQRGLWSSHQKKRAIGLLSWPAFKWKSKRMEVVLNSPGGAHSQLTHLLQGIVWGQHD